MNKKNKHPTLGYEMKESEKIQSFKRSLTRNQGHDIVIDERNPGETGSSNTHLKAIPATLKVEDFNFDNSSSSDNQAII